ncbi:molybdopterin oxidoreductase family protein [Deinococcus peraridilitoris]|uniref:Anaerobic dehydrogenase, typically selenocysteine-containing n=1 Tax=Deinococcus peraridilitoris (strain DSM 19664 / LMG 22246 / CIP 109416 / KR-200) TaxID=937777 RepID=L0A0H8_DEIPD|nr:molybdopterin oxidoreductase family protein [Deinococcus peraridilitoris]AFZ66964.1 anaerobic dehydrogenase, typically selenocysteine-containing [Deinococcus peraridilitoris DSM 19664]
MTRASISASETSREVVLTCPLDCPDACRLKVRLVTGQDGVERAVNIGGDSRHPITRGFACAKTVHYPARQYHPERPLYPLKKVNGEFVRVSWEQALDDIAVRLREILDRYGPQSILRYNYAGTMGLREGSHVHAFFRALGAPELEETICATAGSAAWELGYGSPRLGVDPEDVPHARLILLWGINSLTTNSHLTPWLTQARKNGARIVHIDPYRNKTSLYADWHLKIRPGTDAALVLGLSRIIIASGWHDEAYLARAGEDFGAFRAECEAWSLARTSDVTGLSESEIQDLARALGTTRPTYIRVGYGMTRHENGGSNLRAVTLLPALLGDWQHRGGGCTLTTSGAFALNRTRLGAAHLIESATPRVNMNELASALAPERGVKALFVYNCNPAVVAPDSERVRAGMARPDMLTVVLEQAMTESARLADFVLPATTFLEHADLYTSYGHHYLSYNDATLPPSGEARPNSWVFGELGRRLGIEEPSLYWSMDELLTELLATEHPHLAGITPEKLRREGSVRLSLPERFLPYANGAHTPSGKVRFSPVPRHTEPRAQLNASYPLRLLTPPAHHFLNSTYGNLDQLTRAEGGEPQVLVHPEDARRDRVTDGALVQVQSETGCITRRVRISDAVQRGVAVLEGTWWGLSAPDGKSVNALTAETLTDLGGGSTFHNTRVRLVPVDPDRQNDLPHHPNVQP